MSATPSRVTAGSEPARGADGPTQHAVPQLVEVGDRQPVRDLVDPDVERYLREIRPTEVDQALRFYRDSLNRMTRADLTVALEAAGLETVTIIPWTQRSLVPQLTTDVVMEVQRTYPGVRPEELLQTFVSVIAQKPT